MTTGTTRPATTSAPALRPLALDEIDAVSGAGGSIAFHPFPFPQPGPLPFPLGPLPHPIGPVPSPDPIYRG